jgi:uncharacterized DUF497 family protein
MGYTFIWDEPKDTINRKKHGLSFQEASVVFDDPYLMEFYDEAHSTWDEDRYFAIGLMGGKEVLFIVYTERDDEIRLITARKAEPIEEEAYYEHYKRYIS